MFHFCWEDLDHDVGKFFTFSWSFESSIFVDFDRMLLCSTVVLVWTSVFGFFLEYFNIQTLHILILLATSKIRQLYCGFHPYFQGAG